MIIFFLILKKIENIYIKTNILTKLFSTLQKFTDKRKKKIIIITLKINNIIKYYIQELFIII